MTPHPRGRRPRGSGTRQAILEAAQRQFAEQGYPGTTLRSVAHAAGVDVRLVSHYFGSKQELFRHSVELPFEPEAVFTELLSPGLEGVGHRLAWFVVGLLESPEARPRLTGLLRAAASEDDAAEAVREVLVERLLGPLAERLGVDHPELRSALMGSQLAGLTMARHIVRLPPLVTASREQLVAVLGPVLDHYLTVPLPSDL